MTNEERNEILCSQEFREYADALAKFASGYISRIRKEIADQAIEKFQDRTTRRIVLAYGRAYDKREKDRVDNFWCALHYEGATETYYEDSCLCKCRSYHDTLRLLFGLE